MAEALRSPAAMVYGKGAPEDQDASAGDPTRAAGRNRKSSL